MVDRWSGRSGGVACIAVVAFAYLVLAWLFAVCDAVHAPTPTLVALTVLLGAVLLVGLVAARVWPAGRGRIGTAATATAMALLVADAVLAWRAPTPRSPGGPDKMAALVRLRAAGEPAWLATFPKLFIGAPLQTERGPLQPFGGHSGASLVFCREAEGLATYRSDRYGFRNDDALWDLPELDAVLVGDSFVAGACVAEGATIGQRWSAAGLRVLSLGAAGSGGLGYLGALREYLPGRRARDVVWVHFAGNDLDDLRREAADPILRRYLEPDFQQGLVAAQPAIDRALETWLAGARPTRRWRRGAAGRLTLATLRAEVASLSAGAAPRDTFDLLRDVWTRAARLAEQAGGRLTVAYLPDTSDVMGQSADEAQRAQLRGLATELGLPFIHGSSALEDRLPKLLISGGVGPHYSSEGYRRVAESLLNQLEARP